MTFIARAASLSEPLARALADRISEDVDLGWPNVAISEISSDEWSLEVYFMAPPRNAEASRLAMLAQSVAGPHPVGFSIEELPETDWVVESLRGLKPVRAGRFFVHGAHDRDKRRANDISIEIEAGQAFGTGHHGTTAGCLMAIDRRAKTHPIHNALDIGTGSGVLAIGIAKLTKASVLASDIDPLAVEIARTNTRLNGVADNVSLLTSGALDKRPFGDRAPYDLIVANILAGPLITLAPSISRLLGRGGTLILSGLLPGQKARIIATYRGLGIRFVRTDLLDGWVTLALARGRDQPPAD